MKGPAEEGEEDEDVDVTEVSSPPPVRSSKISFSVESIIGRR